MCIGLVPIYPYSVRIFCLLINGVDIVENIFARFHLYSKVHVVIYISIHASFLR